MIFRWLRAAGEPVPSVRVVDLADVADHLPSDTARVDAEQRLRIIDERRSAVQRRFPR
jgi:hypothetical protein